MGRSLRVLIALGSGAGLVGLAAVLVRVSDLTDFYAVCFWLGVIVVGLALAALFSLAQSPSRVPRRPSWDPYCRESYSAPVVGVSDTERRNVAWASVYLLVAAVPCLLTAAVHHLMLGFGTACYHRPYSARVVRELLREWRTKGRGDALVFAEARLLPGWSVMDRLGDIRAPTLVMAGRDDFQYPSEHQAELAAAIRCSRLEIIERAGHNARAERPAEVTRAVREFLSGEGPPQ